MIIPFSRPIHTLCSCTTAEDQEVLKLNDSALKDIKAEKKKLTVISGATHLFEEPDKLEQVARIASDWFRCYFLIKEHSHQQQL